MLKKFTNWLRINEARIWEEGKWLLDEGIWGHWDYRVPTDKKEQMYDFYMLAYLLSPFDNPLINWMGNKELENPWRPPKVNPNTAQKDLFGKDIEGTGKSYDELPQEAPMTVQMKYQHVLTDVARKLLPFLKEELLQVVGFSIGAELRHVTDNYHQATGSKPSTPEGWAGKNVYDWLPPEEQVIMLVKGGMGNREAQMISKYLKSYKHRKQVEHDPKVKSHYDLTDEPLDKNLEDSDEGYKQSYRAALENGNIEDWARIAEFLFENARWHGSYGGPKWAAIAAGWLRLYRAQKTTEMLIAIDHIYDLEHNTGSVFTKVATYRRNDHYRWIKKSLDHKRYVSSAHELLEHVSGPMRELALIGIKIQTGKSWEDFVNKDWPDILAHKTKHYNDTHHAKLTPWQYQQQIEKSDNPWSVYHFKDVKVKPTKEEININFDDINIGDQVAVWPRKEWKWVTGKHKAGEYIGSDVIRVSDFPGTEEGKGYTVGFDDIYDHRTKAEADKNPDAKPKDAGKPLIEPPTAAAASHGGTPAHGYAAHSPEGWKDTTGKDIEVGDTVKKVVSSTGKNGKVTELQGGGYVHVVWDGPWPEKSYLSTDLLLLKKKEQTPPPAPAAPAPVAPAPTPAAPEPQGLGKNINDFNIGDKVKIAGSKWWLTVKNKQLGNLVVADQYGNEFSYSPSQVTEHEKGATPPATPVAPPAAPAAPQQPWHGVGGSTPPAKPFGGGSYTPPPAPKKPSYTPPTEEEQAQQMGTKAKTIEEELPKLPKPIKYARIIRGLKSQLSFDEIFKRLETLLKVKFSTEDRESIKEAFHKETETIKYYSKKGHMKFPKALNSDQAFNLVQSQFPDAPHVDLDAATDDIIKNLLKHHQDVGAVNVIKKTTQFDTGAAVGLTVLKKMELYAYGDIKD